MARARFIRPEFFTDEKVSDLPFGAALLFAGIWCHSDLRGVFEHSPRVLRGLIFSMRDGIDTATVGEWLGLLESSGMTGRFEASGKTWGYVRNWSAHQQISGRERENGTNRPPPPDHAMNTLGTCSEHARAASPTPTPTPTPTAAAGAVTTPTTSIINRMDQSLSDLQGSSSAPPPARTIKEFRTFGDFQAMNPRIHVPRAERESWEATLRRWGWDALSEACRETAKTLTTPGHRVLLGMVMTYLDKHFEVTP